MFFFSTVTCFTFSKKEAATEQIAEKLLRKQTVDATNFSQ